MNRFTTVRHAVRVLALIAGLSLVAGLSALVIPAAGAPGTSLRSGGTVAIAGGLQPAAAAQSGPPRALAPVDPASPVDYELALSLPGAADLDAYLGALDDPSSPVYHHYLSATQFGARFGLPLSRIARLQAWAESAGIVVLGGFEQRTALRVRSTAGQLARTFGVHLERYRDPRTGLVFHAPLSAPSVPSDIVDAVDGLAGLNTRPSTPAFRPRTPFAPRDVPAGGMTPEDLAAAYDIAPLQEAGVLGDGQTIAVLSFDTFLDADIKAFDTEYNVSGPFPERVVVGPTPPVRGEGSTEVALDLQIVRSVAPRAQILDFEAPNGSVSHADMIDAIVQDGRARIATDSWGRCDISGAFEVGDRARSLHSIQAAAAGGLSMFVASGDHGAFDCWAEDPSDHRATVDFPSDTPFTIAVGGTHLDVRADGSYLSETAWEAYLSTAGSGGGLNPTDARPVWQTGPGVSNQLSNGKRQSPDVAAAADPDTGYRIFYTPPRGAGGWQEAGGTSAAAPFWASSMLLIGQLAQQQQAGRLGFVDPMLYAIASSSAPNTVFHDVARGGNLLRKAGSGWDYATGLGSPDVTALANATVAYLRQHPAK